MTQKEIDQYNATVDAIISNDDLLADFETILEEQKAILIVDGKLSEVEAETRICQPENVRRTALYLVNYI